MAIDPAVIEEIKYRNPIEDVISGYVALKRAGSNLVGLCPFHSEKSPSFTVFVGNGSFYCFGCGAGGNVLSFISKAENLDFVSSVEFLAKRAGITVTRTNDEKNEAYRKRRILEMNREAAKYFHKNLVSDPMGREALQYLLGRGLSMSLIRHFGLGYSPNDFNSLVKYLKKAGYTDKELTDGFLAKISEKNNLPYGMFRNRVMFPIIGITGDVIAFGGRVMDDSKPKYLNSSDTPAFNKRRNLFALNFAKNECSERLILCEGYMDVIALHGAGFSNAVATLGTAITPEQARIMKRYTNEVIICYDADEAGQNAASKAFTLLNEVGLPARILKVKNAKDPDEYIKKFGAAAFKKLLESSRSEFDFRFDQILSKYDIENQEEKIRAIRETQQMIAAIPSSAQRDVYIATVSKKFEVSMESMRHDIEIIIKSKNKTERKRENAEMIKKAEGYGDRVNPDFVKNPKAARAEETILGIFMLHPEYISDLRKKDMLFPPSDFVTEFGRKAYMRMIESPDGFDELSLNESLTPDEISRLTYLKVQRSSLTDNSTALLLECHKTLRSSSKGSSMDLHQLINAKRKNNIQEN